MTDKDYVMVATLYKNIILLITALCYSLWLILGAELSGQPITQKHTVPIIKF